MTTREELMKEIIEVTTVIKTEYPGLYKNITETPLAMSYTNETLTMIDDLDEYLQTLKEQLRQYVRTHYNKI